MSSPKVPPTDSPEYQAFRRFADLSVTKRELNEQLKTIEAQLRALEPVLLNQMSENGLRLLNVDGFCLSPVRVPWVYPQNGVTRASVCEALKLSGLSRFVSEGYSTRTLTKYVRELEEHHDLITGLDPRALEQLLPGPLAHVLEVRPGFRLQVLDRRRKDDYYETAQTSDEKEGDPYEDE